MFQSGEDPLERLQREGQRDHSNFSDDPIPNNLIQECVLLNPKIDPRSYFRKEDEDWKVGNNGIRYLGSKCFLDLAEEQKDYLRFLLDPIKFRDFLPPLTKDDPYTRILLPGEEPMAPLDIPEAERLREMDIEPAMHKEKEEPQQRSSHNSIPLEEHERLEQAPIELEQMDQNDQILMEENNTLRAELQGSKKLTEQLEQELEQLKNRRILKIYIIASLLYFISWFLPLSFCLLIIECFFTLWMKKKINFTQNCLSSEVKKSITLNNSFL